MAHVLLSGEDGYFLLQKNQVHRTGTDVEEKELAKEFTHVRDESGGVILRKEKGARSPG